MRFSADFCKKRLRKIPQVTITFIEVILGLFYRQSFRENRPDKMERDCPWRLPKGIGRIHGRLRAAMLVRVNNKIRREKPRRKLLWQW